MAIFLTSAPLPPPKAGPQVLTPIGLTASIFGMMPSSYTSAWRVGWTQVKTSRTGCSCSLTLIPPAGLESKILPRSRIIVVQQPACSRIEERPPPLDLARSLECVFRRASLTSSPGTSFFGGPTLPPTIGATAGLFEIDPAKLNQLIPTTAAIATLERLNQRIPPRARGSGAIARPLPDGFGTTSEIRALRGVGLNRESGNTLTDRPIEGDARWPPRLCLGPATSSCPSKSRYRERPWNGGRDIDGFVHLHIGSGVDSTLRKHHHYIYSNRS